MNTSPGSAARGGPSGAAVDVDVARRGRGDHGDLPALPGARRRLFGPPPRGRRGSRGDLVLEPLSRSPLRLGELHLRLPLLEGALRGLALGGALRPPARDRALPQPRRGPLRPAPPHPLRRQGELGRVPGVHRHLARGGQRGHRSAGPLRRRRHRSALRALHTGRPRAGRVSGARRITRARGRPGRSTSRASGWP